MFTTHNERPAGEYDCQINMGYTGTINISDGFVRLAIFMGIVIKVSGNSLKTVHNLF